MEVSGALTICDFFRLQQSYVSAIHGFHKDLISFLTTVINDNENAFKASKPNGRHALVVRNKIILQCMLSD